MLCSLWSFQRTSAQALPSSARPDENEVRGLSVQAASKCTSLPMGIANPQVATWHGKVGKAWEEELGRLYGDCTRKTRSCLERAGAGNEWVTVLVAKRLYHRRSSFHHVS